MRKLADNKWVGDLLLALVDSYGEKSTKTIENSEIVSLLSNLRRADLRAEADNLAEELLLTAAGRLSLFEPSAFSAPAFPVQDFSNPDYAVQP